MFKKIGFILLSVSLLSTGCAQAFSLSSLTQKSPVTKKQVLYGGSAVLSLLLAYRSAYMGNRTYANYSYWKAHENDTHIDKARFQKFQRESLKKAGIQGSFAAIFGITGAGLLYKAYTSK